MSPELSAMISEARSLSNMLRSDLDDLANERQPPDGSNGLVTARSRAYAVLQSLGEIEKFAKARGISLEPKVKFKPQPFQGERLW